VRFYELALKISGAVQARRRTRLPSGGFIHSFNGAHSLFVDTIRSLRALALGHLLGQPLMEEQDEKVGLLERLVDHARATARWNVYYGRGRDRYDTPELRGRTSHESLFNVASGTYRGPSTQQGYSPFSTWTRGLAWAMLGFAEQIEFIETLSDDALERCGGRGDTKPRTQEDGLRDLAADGRRRCDLVDGDAGLPDPKEPAEADGRLRGQRDAPGDGVTRVDDELERHDAQDCPAEAAEVREKLRRADAANEDREDGDARDQQRAVQQARRTNHELDGSGFARQPPGAVTRKPACFKPAERS